MTNPIDIEKETKIYIPKITNPQIFTYRTSETDATQSVVMNISTENDSFEKRR